MTVAYRYNNYQDWISAEQKTRPERRKVAQANVAMYSGWCGIALWRTGAYVEAITAFFRTHVSTSLTTPLVLTGVRHTVSQAGLALGCVVSMAEMAITCMVFGKGAHEYRCLLRHLDGHRPIGDAYFRRIADLKEAAHVVKHARSQNDASADRTAPATGSPVIDAAPGTSQGARKQSPENVGTLAKSYFEYEIAQVELPEARNAFKRSLWMFLRDGPLQGGAVGCNLAMLWQAFKVSDLLHIATAPINAVGTAIGGAAFGIACGAFHIIAGALARSEGLQRLAAATGARERIDAAIRKIDDIKAQRQAAVEEAVMVSTTLLRHAAKNEDDAQNAARYQIRVGNRRIAYGTAAIVLAGASLTFFLLAGGLSTGGLLIAVVGGLALAGWVAYAAHRNRKDACKLQAAVADSKGAPPAMTLDVAIERAVAYLDRTGGIGGSNREGRRIIKHALMDIGMDRKGFWALRFCSADPREKGPVMDTLKVLIHNHVDGDGARRSVSGAVSSRYSV
jgi:hypothetical protein